MFFALSADRTGTRKRRNLYAFRGMKKLQIIPLVLVLVSRVRGNLRIAKGAIDILFTSLSTISLVQIG